MKKVLALALLFATNASAASIIPISISEDPINSLTAIIYAISVGVAVVMMMFNGFKWILSDSDQDRFEAKEAIKYILAALALLMVAGILVSVFFGASAPTGYS